MGRAYRHNPDLAIARQEVNKSRAEIRGAWSPFLPSLTAGFDSERYMNVHSTTFGPTFVGSTLVGGQASAYNNYASLQANWNIFSDGKDLAALRAAQADFAAARAESIDSAARTLDHLLDAYNQLLAAARAANDDAARTELFEQTVRDAQLRYHARAGAQLDVLKAELASLRERRERDEACADWGKRSSELLQAVGEDPSPGQQVLDPTDVIPDPPQISIEIPVVAEEDPGVIAAEQQLRAARARLRQEKAAYGPTLTLTARYDALGSAPSEDGAFDQLRGTGYQIGLVLQQTLYPLDTEKSDEEKARADLAEARIKYQRALLKAQSRGAEAERRLATVRRLHLSAIAAERDAHEMARLAQMLVRYRHADNDLLVQALSEESRSVSAAADAKLRLQEAEWDVYAAAEPRRFVSTVASMQDLPPSKAAQRQSPLLDRRLP